MIPLVIDLETFYDREYSLSKITTEQYVRDPQFEVIGVAIKIGDESTQWYPQPEVAAALAGIDWSDKMVVCQNTAFDGAILAWHYDVSPLAWADTLGMSRALFPHDKSHSLSSQATRLGVGVKGTEVLNALGKRYVDFSADELARYGAYCINDVELTHTLFMRYLGMGFPKQELRLIDATLRMFIQPRLVLDKDLLVQHLQAVREYKQQLLDAVRDQLIMADPDNAAAIITEDIKKLLMSNDKFATLLRQLDVEPPMKVSPTTGKPAYAFAKTDEQFKELSEHPDMRVQALVAARLGNKTTLEETRTERFIGMATRGAFPVPLRYYGAHSGRWSGQDSVNLQNLPSRGPYAKALKRAIKAPPGHVVIDCDSAQIEARCLAWLAGQHDLVQAFRDKQDVYKIMASHIYGVAPDQIDKAQRQVGKVVVLGAGYGVGHSKLKAFLKSMAGVEVSEVEAKRIINAYRNTYSCIPYLWDKANRAIEALYSGQAMVVDVPELVRVEPGRGLTLPSGLHIQYPELRREYNDDKKPEWRYTAKGLPTRVYGGLCVENFTQAIARCVVAEQMLRINRRYPTVLTVHDSVACVAPQAEAEPAMAYVIECMSWNPRWAPDLPLSCEAGYGTSYGDC
jgi:DNA polymerase